MGRNQKRRLLAKKEMKKPVSKFEQIDLEQSSFIPKGMTRAYRNTRYTVMIYDNTTVSNGTATKVLIQKLDDTRILNHWYELQKIKNEIFGENVTAVEYYPAVNDLIDDHNIYWIWIFPKGNLPLPIM